MDLKGAWRDVQGDPVPIPGKPGQFYDHLKEVRNAIQSLRNAQESLQELLNDPRLSAEDRAVADYLMSTASKTVTYVTKVINRPSWYENTRVPYEPPVSVETPIVDTPAVDAPTSTDPFVDPPIPIE